MVPIIPKLSRLPLEAYESVEAGSGHVCDRMAANNHRRDFHRICKRAGVEPWSKWCHTLRKNCETDWAQEFPQYVVATWMGHGIEVSARHYLQVPEQLYDMASQSKLQQKLQQNAIRWTLRNRKSLSDKVTRVGLEPTTRGLKGRCSTN